jgi:hypothetical protein
MTQYKQVYHYTVSCMYECCCCLKMAECEGETRSQGCCMKLTCSTNISCADGTSEPTVQACTNHDGVSHIKTELPSAIVVRLQIRTSQKCLDTTLHTSKVFWRVCYANGPESQHCPSLKFGVSGIEISSCGTRMGYGLCG